MEVVKDNVNEKELYLKTLHDELTDDQCEQLWTSAKGIRSVLEEQMSSIQALEFVQKPNSPKVSLIKALVSIGDQVEMLLTCKYPDYGQQSK